jgi:ribosomal protein L28
MSYRCENCNKGTVAGRTQSHHRGVAGKRWKKRAPMTLRVFRPNLQKATIIVSGKSVQVKLCASCIKKFKKEGKIKTFKNRALFPGILA